MSSISELPASRAKITVAIPTYGRDEILISTIEYYLALEMPPQEIIIVDQTQRHTAEVDQILKKWDASGTIRWLRLAKPCIPCAMNRALIEAKNEIVLFSDDDVIPEPGVLAAHCMAHTQFDVALTAGRVIQPWQENIDFSQDEGFHFASPRPAWIAEFMAGNFAVRRDVALQYGGFDEQFVRVAYNFEAEFAFRLARAGYRIYYEPAACIHHLRLKSGGTRMFGEHLRSFLPNHSVGAYYFMLQTWSGWSSLARFFLPTCAGCLDASPSLQAMVDSGNACGRTLRDGVGRRFGCSRAEVFGCA